jgi:prefoldin subunit 5
MTKTEKAVGFVAKVLAKLTGGDEAKVSRFQTKAIKFYKNQITIRQNEVDSLKDKLSDLDEKYQETLINVDLEAIKTSEGVESYIPVYTKRIKAVLNEIETVEKSIETLENQIDEFTALIDDLS